MSVTARAENIPNILKVAEVLETNPNAVMNDCFSGCFSEMEKAPGEPVSLPSIIKKYRTRRGSGMPTSDAAKRNPLAEQVGNLIAILNAEMESLSAGNPPRNAIAVAAINAALTEQSRLLEANREDYVKQYADYVEAIQKLDPKDHPDVWQQMRPGQKPAPRKDTASQTDAQKK